MQMIEKPPKNDLPYELETEQSILQRQIELNTSNVTYIKLFRYASFKDYIVLVVAASCAIIVGAAVPLALVVFGQLLDLFQDARIEDIDDADFNNELKKFTLFGYFYQKTLA